MVGKLKILLLVAGLLWSVGATFDLAGQRKIFYEGGQEEMYDFWMPRMCVDQGYAPAKSTDYGIDPKSGGVRAVDKQVGEIVEFSDWYQTPDGLKFVTGDMDKVYPALALMPYKLFPASRAGAWWFSGICAVIFLAVIFLITRSPVTLLLFALSSPFVFALERGNPIWLSAAAVGVFLAWWDDERSWKRYVAAVCLAFAAVMKIAPAALGLVYLLGRSEKRWREEVARRGEGIRWREIAIAAVAAVILFVVPWFFVKEGFSAIPIMVKNAAHHADFVLRTSDFGLVQLWRSVRLVFGLDVHDPWPGMYLAARFSQLGGLLAMIIGARHRDYLLLVGGMLLGAGNMYYYAALYLLPVFALSRPPSSTSISTSSLHLFSLFLILCPVQFIILGHSANAVLCNFALIAMMAGRVVEIVVVGIRSRT